MRLKTAAILVALFISFSVGSAEAGRKFTDPGDHRHDFSKTSNRLAATTEMRICIFCHTPHGASSQSTLWNRKSPDTGGAGEAYKLYNEVDNSNGNKISIDDIPAAQYSNADQNTYPNGSSRLCLSCHDGVSAVGDVLVGGPIDMSYGTLQDYIDLSSKPDIGLIVLDMTRTHPISFVYDSTVVGELKTTFGKLDYKSPTDLTILDSQKRMQCTTCHDPHDDTRTGTYSLPFWRKYTGTADPTDYEATCDECHIGGSSSTTGSPNIGGNHKL